jgi:hypothetical protein
MTVRRDAPGVPGDKILRALGRYHLLTRAQLTRLLYRQTSDTFVGEHLTRLTRLGYLRMERMPLLIPVGGTPGYWTLREAGRRYLLTAGVLLPPVKHAPLASPYHLRHLLALNDTLIALERLARTEPCLAIERVRHDRDLRREAPRVVLPDGRRTRVVPDAWIDLVVADEPMGIALEVDCGTESDRQWRQKVDGLIALAAGPYRDALGADSMTVATLVVGDARRFADLVRWTEAELVRLGKRHWSTLFWFTAAAPESIEPAALYLAPRWVCPFAPHLRPLLALGAGAPPAGDPRLATT